MGFLDDVKVDQTLQIQVVCVAFFLLVFPAYFFVKAAATDDVAGMGGVGSYTVTADFSYIDFDNGGEYIADGETLTIPLNTDSLSSEEMSKNIVGVLVSMSYDEDEQADGPTCVGPGAGQAAADTITGSESQIIDELVKDGTGLGDYSIEITVNAATGNAVFPCERTDNGEDVSYTVQLIVLDYSITPYIDIDDIDV